MRVSRGSPAGARDGSFAGLERLLIDGNNLLHRLTGGVDPGALRLLLARLRDALPETVATTLMLDGHPASGTDRRQRVARNLDIAHSGSLTADDALINLIRDQSPATRSATTVVTDDISLTNRARHLGAHTQRLAWLEAVLAAGGGPSTARIGAGRPKSPPAPVEVDAAEREPWKPGRGATTKRGNPRRRPH
jgi:rRNA-processing protein FCF1